MLHYQRFGHPIGSATPLSLSAELVAIDNIGSEHPYACFEKAWTLLRTTLSLAIEVFSSAGRSNEGSIAVLRSITSVSRYVLMPQTGLDILHLSGWIEDTETELIVVTTSENGQTKLLSVAKREP